MALAWGVLGGAIITMSPVGVQGRLAGESRMCFRPAGEPGDAVLLNLTPLRADAPGHGELMSSDLTQSSGVSSVNYRPGSVDPNVAVATIGGDGYVCFLNSEGPDVDLVIDHLGTVASRVYRPASPDGSPRRVVDTRQRIGGGRIGSSQHMCFEVAGEPGDAALVNVTPILADAGGHGELLSSNLTQPSGASNVNYAPGSVDPNLAVAPIGDDGKLCYMNTRGASVDVVIDHLGNIAADAYRSASPSGHARRVVDTRRGLGADRVRSHQRVCFATGGDPGDAVLLNLTPVLADHPGHGELLSSDLAQSSGVSNVNYAPGSVDPNLAVATIGADGQVCYLNSEGSSVDLVIDHLGTLGADFFTSPIPNGWPVRRLDTRNDSPVPLVIRPLSVSGPHPVAFGQLGAECELRFEPIGPDGANGVATQNYSIKLRGLNPGQAITLAYATTGPSESSSSEAVSKPADASGVVAIEGQRSVTNSPAAVVLNTIVTATRDADSGQPSTLTARLDVACDLRYSD